MAFLRVFPRFAFFGEKVEKNAKIGGWFIDMFLGILSQKDFFLVLERHNATLYKNAKSIQKYVLLLEM